MEQSHPENARRSSAIYEGLNPSHHSLDSQLALRDHAQPPAGFATATPAGVTPGLGSGALPASGWDDPSSAPAPPHVPFYKKRWFIITSIVLALLGIALLFIILFPVIRAIVQLVVNRSQLDIVTARISAPQNDSFMLNIQGNVTHTGVFSATIDFQNNVTVSWVQNPGTDNTNVTRLGHMKLDKLSAKSKRAKLDQNQQFIIEDLEAFKAFTTTMISSKNFTWRLESNNLHVQALKFPMAKGIKFNKDVTLLGFNNFEGNVTLQDFQLPSDNPAGGINFIAKTKLANLSPFSLDLGTVKFALSYENVSLGIGTGTDTVIVPGEENMVNLEGVLIPHSSPDDLASISKLFTAYLNGETSNVIATGLSTLQTDGSTISWLSEALQHLQLQVPFKSTKPIDPIKSITIGDFALQFDASQPWTPQVESNTVQATMQLPFGFNLAIGEIQNDFQITKDGNPVAGLSTPTGASTSSIQVLGETNTVGTINISITNTRLSCPDPQHPAFSSFNADLTQDSLSEFRLVGGARAVANLSIGQITFDPIKVNVSTSLHGLQGLKGMTTIEDVDVIGGTQDGIQLDIKVAIFNPSNLNLDTGDLTLQLMRNGTVMGTVLLPNLTLAMGNNTVAAKSTFKANDSPEGHQTLNEFIGLKDVPLTITGFDNSTDVASLTEAFKTLNLDVVLPGLNVSLLDTAALEVLSSTGRENNVSHVTVSLQNPFSAALHITSINSSVTSFGIPLGTIDSKIAFTTAPKSTTKSPSLDLNMNFDPSALFSLTRILAIKAGLDPAPLDGIVKLGHISYLPSVDTSSSSRRQSSLYDNFDLPSFVQSAFKKLQSDVQLTTGVTIGEYSTALQYTQTGVPTVTDESLNLILPILAHPIVQMIVGGSTLSIESVVIHNPQQNSFGTRLKGNISNAGPFDAKISFPSGLTVNWKGKPLGMINMKDVQVTGDVGGNIDIDSTFEVADIAHLTEFTKTLLTEETFDWDISGENLTVAALGISVPGISLSSKRVTLNGFNGLKDGVKILSFDLPSDDPAGGIHLTLQATTTNPSQVGIELDSITFDTFVGDTIIAPVSARHVTLAPQSTSELSLVGRLIPQNSAAGLAAVSQVFNNFIHGLDSDVIVHGSSAGPSGVTWLNDGIKALQVASVLPNQGPLNIIKSIKLEQLGLLFTEDTAYNPKTSSKKTDAAFTLPFNFPLDVTALEQTITIGFEGADFAQLAIPRGPSTTDVVNRIIHITFDNVPFAVYDSQHSVFDRFVAATTIGSTQTLRLKGSANADAKTAVGLLSLTGIDFSVASDIDGLQGLNARPVTVRNLDVNHGFTDFLLIKVDSDLFNPSNLTIGTGDVSFKLQFQDQTIGSADISNLLILPGSQSYPIDVHYAPQSGTVDAGRALLENFLQGINSDTSISGSASSTPINSLKMALSQVHLSPVTIPALNMTLIKSASLSFPTDVVQTGVASTSFTLANPFSASINLLRVGAVASFQNLTLGKINSIDLSSHPIRAEGHGKVTSQPLPIDFNLDPVTIIHLLLITSQQNGVDLGPLTDLFQFVLQNPDFKPPVKTTVDNSSPTCVSGHQFDANGAILRSLAGLKVDLAVDSSVKLDDFATDLAFDQLGVPASVDRSVLFLIGDVAGPIAQRLVDGSILAFTEADITNITNEGFDLALRGSLTNVGALDALITFVDPVTVTWEAHDIAVISLSPICVAANSGVPHYNTNAHLTITDVSGFTDFVIFLLHNPSFEWTISTKKLRLNALGTIFDNISLSKVVSFKAFNGLPGVTISNFQLPSDDPAGGITIETDAVIPSPAQLGIDLGDVTFSAFANGTFVGPLAATNLVLRANTKTSAHLHGRIVPQSGSDLANIGVLFSNFLAGENQTLETRGDTVQPPGSDSPVSWLTTAFKTLSLNVVLPGEILNVIQSIDINDLAVTIRTQDQAFSPPTSSANTLAKYKNPFGFSLQVIEAGQSLILKASNVNVAQLDLPVIPADGGISTGNVVDLHISFQNQPLKSLNDAAFSQLFAGVTLTKSVDIDIKGSANVVAATKIGDVAISGIPIDVSSTLEGIDSFGGTAGLSNVTVTGSGGNGGSEFITTPLTTTLQNPSNVSLDTVDISLPVKFNGVTLGRAVITEFDLKPGENDVASEFRYMPDNANDTIAQSFLTDFITSAGELDLIIDGDSSSSPFASLQPALANLQLSTKLAGLNHPNLITQVHVFIPITAFDDNLVDVDFDMTNPLDTDLVIEHVQSDAGIDDEVFAQFSQSFSTFIIPAGGTANSGRFKNVILTQGLANSLDLVLLGILDIKAAATVRVGEGGYEIPWLKLAQQDVPTDYEFVTDALSTAPLEKIKEIASQIARSKTAKTVSQSTTSAPSTSQSLSGLIKETGKISSDNTPFSSSAVKPPSNPKESSKSSAQTTPESLSQAPAPSAAASPQDDSAQISNTLTASSSSQ